MSAELDMAYYKIYQYYKDSCSINEPWSLNSYYKAKRKTYEKVLRKLDECRKDEHLHPCKEIAELMDFDTQHGKYTDSYFDAMVDTYILCLTVLKSYYEDKEEEEIS